MHTRLIPYLLALICCFATANGQTTAPQVMANAIKAINAAPSLEAKFTAKTSGAESIAGSLRMRSDRFCMVTDAFGTWYDGTNMWSYSRSTGETSLTEPTDDELLEANPFFIVNQYSAYYKPEIVRHAAGAYVIRLRPATKNAPMKSADITVNGSTWLPTAITAQFDNGSEVSIDITSMHVLKSALPASAFVYPASKYQGVEVIDLR